MTELDAEMVPLALELIAEYGKEVQYAKVTPGDYDTETGEAAPAGAPVGIKALVEDVVVRNRSSGLIEGSYKKFTIAGASFAERPTASDTFSIDGFAHIVADGGVKGYYSGELIALYEIWASV